MTAEQARLKEARERKAHWKKWGPCLRKRQWGDGKNSTFQAD
jgi:hypothetical protein